MTEKILAVLLANVLMVAVLHISYLVAIFFLPQWSEHIPGVIATLACLTGILYGWSNDVFGLSAVFAIKMLKCLSTVAWWYCLSS